MRIRALLTMFLAAFLLSSSSIASACQLSCDLELERPSCHSTASESPAMLHHTAGSHNCEMSNGSSSVHAMASSICEHSVCQQQPQLVAVDQTLLHTRSKTVLHSLLIHPIFLGSAGDQGAISAEAPAARVPLLVALRTNLRV